MKLAWSCGFDRGIKLLFRRGFSRCFAVVFQQEEVRPNVSPVSGLYFQVLVARHFISMPVTSGQ